jgi:integrase
MTTAVIDRAAPLLLASAPPERCRASREEIAELVCRFLPQDADLLRKRLAAVGSELDRLEQFAGDDWQTRWETSGSDVPSIRMAGTSGRRPAGREMTALIVLDVVRPLPSWFSRATPSHLFIAYRRLHEPVMFNQLTAAIAAEEATRTAGMLALTALTRVRLHTGVPLQDVSPADFSAVVDSYRRSARRLVAVELAWRALQATGGLIGAGPNERAHNHAGPASVEHTIDRFGIQCRPIRDLLVAYVREREPSVDHSTMLQLSSMLACRFWLEIENIEPGVSDLRLKPETIIAWKDRVRYRPDGSARRGANLVLMAVRSLYLDISQWALAEPEKWAIWAAPPPVSTGDTAGAAKQHRRQQAEMHQRTRTLAPLLPALVRAADQRYRHASKVLTTSRATAAGDTFEIDGLHYERLARSGHYTDGDRRPAVRTISGQIVQAFQREDEAFWIWAAIEVLRHTGIRCEELLELTHLSIRRYTQPDGEVIPLLQIAPSKNDAERVLPIPPELATVLAQIITRLKAANGTVPLVARYDSTQRSWLPAQPHLFQRRFGGKPTVIDGGFIRKLLVETAEQAGLRDVDGTPIKFTPHDFRRIFATEAVTGGLPVHIAQQLLGHLDLNTTSGYLAVYPQQVINQYRAFINRRRERRPDDEYRAPTPDEWTEFEEHFVLRRVALGTCHRPYGTPCIHEHACVRCPMLRVDPTRRDRLEELGHNLNERLTEARNMNWHGEIDGIIESLHHLTDKLAQLDRVNPTPVTLLDRQPHDRQEPPCPPHRSATRAG